MTGHALMLGIKSCEVLMSAQGGRAQQNFRQQQGGSPSRLRSVRGDKRIAVTS